MGKKVRNKNENENECLKIIPQTPGEYTKFYRQKSSDLIREEMSRRKGSWLRLQDQIKKYEKLVRDLYVEREGDLIEYSLLNDILKERGENF